MRPLFVSFVIVAGLTATQALEAQVPAMSVVRLVVNDTAGAPIPEADVSVTLGIHQLLASGVTDDRGARALTFTTLPADLPADLQVTARKIGYSRADRLFQLRHADTISLVLRMRRTVQTLAPVTVTAEAERKRAYYQIDADAIAASTEQLTNAWDVVAKLRPDMLTGHVSPSCGGISDVFVNGKRVPFAPRPAPTDAMHARASAPLRSGYNATVVSVLSTIKPEHIEDMQYHDCFDTSVRTVGHTSALFITLKPGVEYDVGVESYVLPLPANRQP